MELMFKCRAEPVAITGAAPPKTLSVHPLDQVSMAQRKYPMTGVVVVINHRSPGDPRDETEMLLPSAATIIISDEDMDRLVEAWTAHRQSIFGNGLPMKDVQADQPEGESS